MCERIPHPPYKLVEDMHCLVLVCLVCGHSHWGFPYDRKSNAVKQSINVSISNNHFFLLVQSRSLHRHVVDMLPYRTSQFSSSFLMRTAKGWNALPATVFSDQYNMDVFKTTVNRLFLAMHAPSSTASSFNIRGNHGQIPVYNMLKKVLFEQSFLKRSGLIIFCSQIQQWLCYR